MSDTGLIKSPRGKILKPTKDKKGYLRIDLPTKTCKVHRMVAANFVPNPFNLPQVNHLDTNKQNNNYQNLSWSTNTGNVRHAVENNLYKKRNLNGSLNGYSKLTEEDVRTIRKSFKPRVVTRAMLAKEFNVSPATIKDVILNKSWRHMKMYSSSLTRNSKNS